MRRFRSIKAVPSTLSLDEFTSAVKVVSELLKLEQITVPTRYMDDLWLREKRNFWSTPGYWIYKINFRISKAGIVALVEAVPKERLLVFKWEIEYQAIGFAQLLQAFVS